MRGSGLRSPTTADSMKTSKYSRRSPVPPSSVIQLLVSAATLKDAARRRRIASSIAGRGTAISATRRIISRAWMSSPGPARRQAPDPPQHRGTRHGDLGHAPHHLAGVDRQPGARAVRLEARVEPLEVEPAALQTRPGTARSGRHDDAIHGVAREPELALVV